MIHENINIRDIYWNLFNIESLGNSPLLLLYVIILVISVFFISLGLDLLRRGTYYMIKKIRVVQYIVDKINKKIEIVNCKINKIFIKT